MTAGRICCVCQKPIVGDAKVLVRHSASGVRPNDHAHLADDPECNPGPPRRSSVARRLPRRP